MKGGFNSSFIEIRTLEGDKFITDLKVGDVVKSIYGYCRVKNIFQRAAKPNEAVFNIYYHDENKEGVLERISGDQIVYVKSDGIYSEIEIKDLVIGQTLRSRESAVVIDQIERMETVNRFFYNIDIGREDIFYADDICIKSIECKN